MQLYPYFMHCRDIECMLASRMACRLQMQVNENVIKQSVLLSHSHTCWHRMTSSNGNFFPRYWPFVRGYHRSPVNSPHKGQWRGTLMFSLICASINGWVNNHEAGDLRRHRAHYDVTVMTYHKYNHSVYNGLTWSINRTISQISQSTCPISHIAPFRIEMCLSLIDILLDMGNAHCGICKIAVLAISVYMNQCNTASCSYYPVRQMWNVIFTILKLL